MSCSHLDRIEVTVLPEPIAGCEEHRLPDARIAAHHERRPAGGEPVDERGEGFELALAADEPELLTCRRHTPSFKRDGAPRRRGEGYPAATTNATSSTKHQLQSSPGSADRAIG